MTASTTTEALDEHRELAGKSCHYPCKAPLKHPDSLWRKDVASSLQEPYRSTASQRSYLFAESVCHMNCMRCRHIIHQACKQYVIVERVHKPATPDIPETRDRSQVIVDSRRETTRIEPPDHRSVRVSVVALLPSFWRVWKCRRACCCGPAEPPRVSIRTPVVCSIK